MKTETFKRTIPWYESRPKADCFIYQDKTTRLWFVIEQLNYREEIQGSGYAIITAYRRYCDECQRKQNTAKPLDTFTTYAKLEREVSYQVRNS